MKMPWRLFITAMLFVAHTVTAAESESEEDERYPSAAYGVGCPGEYFSSFFDKFSNDAGIQREYAEYQLIKKELDLSAAPEVRKIITYLGSNHIKSPVLPLRAAREKQSLKMIKVRQRYFNENPKVILIKPNTDDFTVYEFVLNGCWYLSSIDHHASTARHPQLYWMDAIFPAMDNCTPYYFYFDPHTKRTSNGVLERKGYTPYQVESSVAKYKVHDKFMGLDATEITIPTSPYGMYKVTLPVSVERLTAAVEKNTGHRLAIAIPKFKSQSGVPYLVEEGKNTSSFICAFDAR
ncbi:hypothetical protein XFHB_12765 [Xylella fastidiosa]|uniref:Uncharacterized protein n=1 Tax=Xylella fastidiosa TaxID=2371 RepID=A0ABC8AGG0_XYLFS|nr:hypothetical protein [Xylella fastidiosa]ALR07573.1 hypothetical protein XFHB_12765 [Xylella fastidiosa]